MINLKGYDEVEGARPGEFVRLPAGGYVCIVTDAESTQSRNGQPMLVLTLDIAEGEFARLFEKASYPPKYRQLIYNYGKVSRFLKGLLQDFIKSNSGFTVNTVAFDEKSLIGKKIGMLFAEEEYETNGAIKMKVNPRRAITVEEIRKGNFEIPPLKKLERVAVDDDFVGDEIPDHAVPF